MSKCQTCPSKNTCPSQSNNQGCSIEFNPNNKIINIIGVMSGKGGVGKSTISVLIAKKLNSQGYKVGILDADITGPSIPRLLNIQNLRAEVSDEGIPPVTTEDGIKVMSLNLLTENEDDPVLWRGPVIGKVVKQFWNDVMWGELDYLIVDMPPGTGDVAITVMQSIPISGVVMVSIPNDMVSMIVSKAINMAKQLNVKVLGVIQNMSYVLCPDCNRKIEIFDGENIEQFMKESNLTNLGELPMAKDIINISKISSDNVAKDVDSIIGKSVELILSQL